MIINDTDIEIERKPIKNLRLAVYPPDGRVHASVPEEYCEEQIRIFLLKWAWLLSKRQEVTSYTVQQGREYVYGESHYIFGIAYRLKVVSCSSGSHQVVKKGDYIDVYDSVVFKPTFTTPYTHLSNEPFWEWVKTDDFVFSKECSMGKLHRSFYGAKIPDNLFELMQNASDRLIMTRTQIN